MERINTEYRNICIDSYLRCYELDYNVNSENWCDELDYDVTCEK